MARRNTKLDGPDPIDIFVGKRIRERRMSLGMSQEKLADEIGLTFQQTQKYEKGLNRVSASKLWYISEALNVPVSFFYDGLRDGPSPEIDALMTRRNGELLMQIAAAPESIRAIITSLLRDVATAAGDEPLKAARVHQPTTATVSVEAPPKSGPETADLPEAVVAETPKRRGRPRKNVEVAPTVEQNAPPPPRPTPAREIRTNKSGYVTHINGKKVS